MYFWILEYLLDLTTKFKKKIKNQQGVKWSINFKKNYFHIDNFEYNKSFHTCSKDEIVTSNNVVRK